MEDTNSHTVLDDLSHNDGKFLPSAPLSRLEIETKGTIASFNNTGELPNDIRQHTYLPDPSPPVPPSVSDQLW